MTESFLHSHDVIHSAATPRSLIGDVADIVEIETLGVAERLDVGVWHKSPLTRIFGLRTSLVLFAPAEFGFQ